MVRSAQQVGALQNHHSLGSMVDCLCRLGVFFYVKLLCCAISLLLELSFVSEVRRVLLMCCGLTLKQTACLIQLAGSLKRSLLFQNWLDETHLSLGKSELAGASRGTLPLLCQLFTVLW